MPRPGYCLSLTATGATVVLLAYRGFEGSGADWVHGMLTVLWSLLMIARLTAITNQAEPIVPAQNLAQKIIRSLWQKHDENNGRTLDRTLNAGYALFGTIVFSYAAWQIYCAAFPAQQMEIDSLRDLASASSAPAYWNTLNLFHWGQGFMTILSLIMMAFVLRSYAGERSAARGALIIMASYAAAGFLFFSSLAAPLDLYVNAGLTGNGIGSWAMLMGTYPAKTAPRLFDLLLLEGGVAGLGLLAVAVFIPLGAIAMSAYEEKADTLISACGMIAGLCLLLSVFLPCTPALGAYLALCAAGLFLAWGAADLTPVAYG